MPVSLLDGITGPGGALDGDLVPELERLGVRTLGQLAELPADAVADRFGAPGLRARSLARGRDEPLRPRPMFERLRERLDLPHSNSGPQLQRALELLVDRLLARPQRRARTLRRLRLTAGLVSGGSWSSETAMREASAEPDRLRIVLAPKLAGLPAPAEWLELEALGFGSATGIQSSLDEQRERRRNRLAEAVRQVRATAGPDAVLRVLELDPASRVPERRMTLTPFPEDG
jgi:protein ImuB